MFVCLSLGAFLLGIGAFLVFADILLLPTRRAERAMRAMGRRLWKRPSPLRKIYEDIRIFASGLIRLDGYRRERMVSDLQAAGLPDTPEEFLAGALLKALGIGLLAIPTAWLMPLLTPLVIALAILSYFRDTKQVGDRIRIRREAVEAGISGLVSYVDRTLAHSRDVLTMLERYRDTAPPALRRELDITVADMRSGNYESALIRMESRVGSAMLSDVTRGLIGILRGDDTRLYWASLAVKFTDIRRQALRRQAMKAPAKVHRLSFALLGCFLLTYLVVLATAIAASLGAALG